MLIVIFYLLFLLMLSWHIWYWFWLSSVPFFFCLQIFSNFFDLDQKVALRPLLLSVTCLLISYISISLLLSGGCFCDADTAICGAIKCILVGSVTSNVVSIFTEFFLQLRLHNLTRHFRLSSAFANTLLLFQVALLFSTPRILVPDSKHWTTCRFLLKRFQTSFHSKFKFCHPRLKLVCNIF